jgi:transposase
VKRGPKAPAVHLSSEERRELERLVRGHLTPQVIALRGRIVLAAADGLDNAEIAEQLHVGVKAVRRWRGRWLGLQAATLEDLPVAERLTDVPRTGRPSRITAEQVCQIIELACEAPEKSGRPISQWSASEIAKEVIQRGIVETISDRHAARLLKRGVSSRTAGATG